MLCGRSSNLACFLHYHCVFDYITTSYLILPVHVFTVRIWINFECVWTLKRAQIYYKFRFNCVQDSHQSLPFFEIKYRRKTSKTACVGVNYKTNGINKEIWTGWLTFRTRVLRRSEEKTPLRLRQNSVEWGVFDISQNMLALWRPFCKKSSGFLTTRKNCNISTKNAQW